MWSRIKREGFPETHCLQWARASRRVMRLLWWASCDHSMQWKGKFVVFVGRARDDARFPERGHRRGRPANDRNVGTRLLCPAPYASTLASTRAQPNCSLQPISSRSFHVTKLLYITIARTFFNWLKLIVLDLHSHCFIKLWWPKSDIYPFRRDPFSLWVKRIIVDGINAVSLAMRESFGWLSAKCCLRISRSANLSRCYCQSYLDGWHSATHSKPLKGYVL